MSFPCCVANLGCVVTEDEDECIAMGGWDNEFECDNPLSMCGEMLPEVLRGTEPEGCYEQAPTWQPDPTRKAYTLDLCEHVLATPSFIRETEIATRCEPVSTHESRAQPVGEGQDPCGIDEGFLAIDNEGIIEPLMCTARASERLRYAYGMMIFSKFDDNNFVEARILFSTEAPFPVEENLFSKGHMCAGPPI